ncbi:hypothetical protein SERLADRAFT_437568 [Serpula lacrymans var. lacrymans S7.9]|uniref:DUF6830 domain-containing protein n=1 Tax=Serpula lacrymans var. lacrymans (strain S7.9) TaxID=578457 RepID=F8NUD4_SERL9|nr:uncharacterized protein SERLADRAFT_437568 [Serpula lacrymans var. lacrymans S7.9]EGO25846.1 hypothetical protein SERLADRAFT_437568 [Serpula lacrymans var. lacrymans S7.9]
MIYCPCETCPHRMFKSWDDLLQHLNDPNTGCLPVINTNGGCTDHSGYHYHPLSGYTYGTDLNILEQMQAGKFAKDCKTNCYYPFVDRDELELARFLCENMNQSEINRFLKLPWICKHSPSFTSSCMLFSWIEALPSGPRWKVQEMKLEGFPTKKPLMLLWRDGLEVVQHLFSNPVFANNVAFDPKAVYATNFDFELEKQYGEFFTGNYVWECQDRLPVGATLVGIIGASDKTMVTRGTGGLEMHPIFFTIGNINSQVRMKATSHAWICAGFLPIPKFNRNSDIATLLSSRVYHACMDKITHRLKDCARNGAFFTDPFGQVQHTYTPLVVWIADLPEQQLIACVAKNSSPVTLASLKQFGDAETYPSRHEAKKIGLSGVYEAFWRDWAHSNPATFIVPEILHTCHKFFFDHILVWCKEIMGKPELDACREHWDIQRSIVAVICGRASPTFLRVIRAMIDFIYQAQAPVHSAASIVALEMTLGEFHREKDAILQAGVRKGKNGPFKLFWIPKLELMQSFGRAILQMGSIMQYTTDVTERLLITHFKHPFSNGKNHRSDFELQCARILDWLERIQLFHILTLLLSHGLSLMNTLVEAEEETIFFEMNPEDEWISRVLPEEKSIQGIRTAQNLFLKGILSEDCRAAFHTNSAPDLPKVSINQAAQKFGLKDFFIRYAIANGDRGDALSFNDVHVWFKFRIQLFSVHRPKSVMSPQMVHAQPPSPSALYGSCDPVLVNKIFDEKTVSEVAQVRMIFQPVSQKGGADLPIWLKETLLYIQNFDFTWRGRDDMVLEEPDINMYLVERSFSSVLDSSGQRMRAGEIIPLVSVSHAVGLIPHFGHTIDPQLTMNNSLKIPIFFYLNHYADKELYQTLL